MYNGLSSEVLKDLADRFGTPLYVYDADKIETQYQLLEDLFKDRKVRFFYAAKALTNIHILKLIASFGASIDCSSINEVLIARYAGIPPEKILYTSNGISFSEIEIAKNEGVFINIDSLSNLRKFGKKFGGSYPVGIRLRPNVMAGGNLKIATGHDKSKFGIPVDELDQILEVVKEYDLQVSVLHVHTGSGISDVAVYMQAVNVLLRVTGHFPDLKYIDLGGGFKVPYKEDEHGVDMDLLSSEVSKAIAKLEIEQGRQFEIWFEPGKFLVSEAGYLISKVDVIKKTANATFAGVNTGFNQLIRPMFYGAYHRIDNISNPHGELQNYAVVGNLCETDTFAWDRPLPEIREDDLLVFRNAGAYGFEMASSFNSRCRPAEVMVRKGSARLIRVRESLDDLLRNQINL